VWSRVPEPGLADPPPPRAAPELAAFIKWVRKQPITRKKRNKERRRKI
jgi:hypothetical protein